MSFPSQHFQYDQTAIILRNPPREEYPNRRGLASCSIHTTQPVNATDDITIYYKVIPTGRYIENGAIKPDIVVWDRKSRSAIIIDVSVPNDFGINRAERDKVTKYQDLKHALKDEWDLQDIAVIPVIVGATGMMKDNLQSYLDSIPGKPSKYQVQVAAIRGTVSLLKRALGTNFK